MDKYKVVCSKCGTIGSGMDRQHALAMCAQHIIEHNKKNEFWVNVHIEVDEPHW